MNKGKVTLVGAGPYDKGLITVKGLDAIRKADCILYDRLINPAFLHEAPVHCEKIDVGKASSEHTLPQDKMNALLIEKAREGKNVVRLKGGDPFIFGRGGEELAALPEAGIPFEVVPGVTSAAAAPAYAGIPVTHRDFASSLHIITGHAREGKKLEIDFEPLAKLSGTLVFLMGISALPFICEGLLNAGRDGDAAIIENGTTAKQRLIKGTVGTLTQLAKERNVKSPAIIVVGDVVKLSDTLGWLKDKPLAGIKILLACHAASADKLGAMLYEKGCDIVYYPCAAVDAIPFAPVDFSEYDYITFTSKQGVRMFFDGLREKKTDIRLLGNIKLAAVGTETAKELMSYGVFADFVPASYKGESLAEELLPLLRGGKRALLVEPSEPSPPMREIFDREGILYTSLPVYKTRLIKNEPAELSGMDYVTFTSASAVSGFALSMEGQDLSMVHAVCIGPQTAAAARKLKMKVTVSEEHSFAGMLKKIEGLVRNGTD